MALKRYDGQGCSDSAAKSGSDAAVVNSPSFFVHLDIDDIDTPASSSATAGIAL